MARTRLQPLLQRDKSCRLRDFRSKGKNSSAPSINKTERDSCGFAQQLLRTGSRNSGKEELKHIYTRATATKRKIS